MVHLSLLFPPLPRSHQLTQDLIMDLHQQDIKDHANPPPSNLTNHRLSSPYSQDWLITIMYGSRYSALCGGAWCEDGVKVI